MAGDAAWGMWNRAGCFSTHYGTDGFVPDWWVKQQPQGRVKAKRLVEVELWHPGEYDGDRPEYQGQKGFNFHQWRQDSYAQVEADREKWRKKKQAQRGSSDEMSPGDTEGDIPRDSLEDTDSVETLKPAENSPKSARNSASNNSKKTTPQNAATSGDNPMSPGDSRGSPGYIPFTPYPQDISGYVQSAAYESDATRERDDLSPPVNIGATRLVERTIPANAVNDSIRTGLRIEASQLLGDGETETDVEACLRLWMTKPNLGVKALPALMAEVYKSRNGTNGKPVHKLRVLAELEQQTRIEEQLESAYTPRELT